MDTGAGKKAPPTQAGTAIYLGDILVMFAGHLCEAASKEEEEYDCSRDITTDAFPPFEIT